MWKKERQKENRFLLYDSWLNNMWNSQVYFPFHRYQFCYENSSKAKVQQTSWFCGTDVAFRRHKLDPSNATADLIWGFFFRLFSPLWRWDVTGMEINDFLSFQIRSTQTAPTHPSSHPPTHPPTHQQIRDSPTGWTHPSWFTLFNTTHTETHNCNMQQLHLTFYKKSHIYMLTANMYILTHW